MRYLTKFLILLLIALVPPSNLAQNDVFSGWITYSQETADGDVVVLRNLDTGQQTFLTPPDMYASRSVLSPALNRVAFLSRIDGNNNIYVVNIDGTNLTQITNSVNNEFNVAWSQDGNTIIYVRDSGGLGFTDIYTTNTGGSFTSQLLTTSSSRNWHPRISPDGYLISFVSDRNSSPNYDLFVMDRTGNNLRLLAEDVSRGSAAQWSSDGTKIGFQGLDGDYYYVKPDGTGLTKIVESNFDTGGLQWLNNQQIMVSSSLNISEIRVTVYDLNGIIQGEYRFNRLGGEDFNFAQLDVLLPDMRAITSFSLIDPATNSIIQPLTGGDFLYLDELAVNDLVVRAGTTPTTVGSVEFMIEQIEFQTDCPFGTACDTGIGQVSTVVDNTVPYEVSNPAVSGRYRISATPYSQANATGDPGDSQSISFIVEQSNDAGAFTLVNAATDTDIAILQNGDVISTATVGSALNIRANIAISGARSVVFRLNGVEQQTDNNAPYALANVQNGDYDAWSFTSGVSYRLLAEVYDGNNGNGTRLETFVIHFTID